MIRRKSKEEIQIMHDGGRKLAVVLQRLLVMAKPGVVLLEIEKQANSLIDETGGSASFKTVKGYHWSTCLCVNEVVVHGIPTSYVLKQGDVLTIDIGLIYKGFHTDTAWTKIVGGEDSQFLKVGQEALNKAIGLAKIGNRIGDISASTQGIVEGAGYNVVKSLVGHGVGRQLHEEPQVPNYLPAQAGGRGSRENTYTFQGGETIAIEPIYVAGDPAVVLENDDGWTLATRDRSLAAVFEHSIAITPDGPIVLTQWEK